MKDPSDDSLRAPSGPHSDRVPSFSFMKDPSDDSLGNGLGFSSVRDASYLLKSGGSCA